MEISDAITLLQTVIANNMDDDFNVDVIRANPNVPGAIIYPDAPFEWRETFDGMMTPRFCVLILVPYIDTADAGIQLNGYLARTGTGSVPAAIESDARFSIRELKSYGVTSLSDGGTEYLTAELLVEINI